MPSYDLYCKTCDHLFENAVMPYEEMKEAMCPICQKPLLARPGRFKFDVKGSARARRQELEARFRRREKRIDKEFTPAQKDRFESFCDRYGCRKRF